MYKPVTKCRACDYGAWDRQGKAGESTERLIPVLDLGVQPLANDFRQGPEERAGYAPLQVLFCPRCSLAQLSVVVRPDILYRNYSYVTSPSETMKNHFATLSNDLLTETYPGAVVEIGSNDGLFLAYLRDRGFGNVVGIDPAVNLAAAAKAAGVMTINSFINREAATAAREVAGEVSVIVARHCFCHIDDWRAFMDAVGIMASAETLVCIEVPYAVDQLTARSFDQVYHEHLSFLTLKAMKHLLNGGPFHLHRICRYSIHGGAIAIMLRRNDSLAQPHPSVEEYLSKENITAETWKAFADESELQIIKLRDTVRELVASGKRVCGYGASAKATVWINACGFTKQDLLFVCDSTAQKVGRLIPGTDIPVFHEGDHFVQCCDYVVLFAWNFAREIMVRENKFGHTGFSWIIPVPTVQIVPC